MCFTRDLSSKYRSVKFINLPFSSLGVVGKSSNSFIVMCNDLNVDKLESCIMEKHSHHYLIHLLHILHEKQALD